MVWIVADVWEAVAAERPDASCIVQGGVTLSWRDFDQAADTLAASLVDFGLVHQSKVAFFVDNSPAFLIGVFACLKAGLVPVNTNSRYGAAEVVQLWSDGDVECVVFSGRLREVTGQARDLMPGVRAWLDVDDDADQRPDWALEFGGDRPQSGPFSAAWGREADDLLLLYTGGTTGSPKGVMWRQDDLFGLLNRSAAVRYVDTEGLPGVRARQRADTNARPVLLPVGPLVHAAAAFAAYGVLGAGGTVVLLEGRSFDAREVLDVIDREEVSHLALIGDSHARPIIDLLDAQAGNWSLASLTLITSAGMAFSEQSRSRLLAHLPNVMCVDILGSSETPMVGRARSTIGSVPDGAVFERGRYARVLDDAGREVEPGSDVVGVVAIRGRTPIGYYNDPARTDAVFRTIDGERWALSGDRATVRPDGSILLLGRDSTVINTGGEKVYTLEVEDALTRDPSIADAAVVGLPDPVFGQMVVAAVQVTPGGVLDLDLLRAGLRERLAGYKVPKQIHVVDSLDRGENGKIDVARLGERLLGMVGD